MSLLGTAFALGGDKLGTAAHVVGGTDDNLALIIPRQRSLLDYQDSTDSQVQHTPVRIHAIDPIRDHLRPEARRRLRQCGVRAGKHG